MTKQMSEQNVIMLKFNELLAATGAVLQVSLNVLRD